jgi:hypothetical protein
MSDRNKRYDKGMVIDGQALQYQFEEIKNPSGRIGAINPPRSSKRSEL